MHKRILVVVDREGSTLRSLVASVKDIADGCEASARVLHVIDLPGRRCAPPFDTVREAERLLEHAVFDLRMSGLGADGVVRAAGRSNRASLVVDEANRWEPDTIVVGSYHWQGRESGGGCPELAAWRPRVPLVVVPEAGATLRR
jgi:nucleotide-binding universal stress UspA family protein